MTTLLNQRVSSWGTRGFILGGVLTLLIFYVVNPELNATGIPPEIKPSWGNAIYVVGAAAMFSLLSTATGMGIAFALSIVFPSRGIRVGVLVGALIGSMLFCLLMGKPMLFQPMFLLYGGGLNWLLDILPTE